MNIRVMNAEGAINTVFETMSASMIHENRLKIILLCSFWTGSRDARDAPYPKNGTSRSCGCREGAVFQSGEGIKGAAGCQPRHAR
ncbi:MAG: hypothetical protein H7839_03245 [Magnetococcus sp. YQC-5]